MTSPGQANTWPREWLLTNRLGAFAMGSSSGVPLRRYHALLVASRRPPVDRVALLGAIDEHVCITTPGEGTMTRVEARLTPFRFAGADAAPSAPASLVGFECDLVHGRGCAWRHAWRLEGARGERAVAIVKRVRLARERNAIEVAYEVDAGEGVEVALTLSPLVGVRDFHTLTSERAGTPGVRPAGTSGSGVVVWRREGGGEAAVHLVSPEGEFTPDEAWWRGFEYDIDRERGQDFREDLFCPGRFSKRGRGRWTLRLRAGDDDRLAPDLDREGEAHAERVGGWARCALSPTPRAASERSPFDAVVARLVAASDAFVVRRDEASSVSLIAGYPWFADWGRDSMIALPGVLLATGRFDEGERLLATFARHRRRGLIPNLFDDRTGEAHYNTADASLWFVHACCEWAAASGRGFPPALLEACLDVVEWYARGTDFDIRVEPGLGLVRAGNPGTQLTWMDAARDGVVFTPRHGLCVEVNALWVHALASLAEHQRANRSRSAAGGGLGAKELRALAERASASFNRLFWNDALACCHDRLEPDAGGWRAVPEVRPNQIFAASLRHSPLSVERRRGVVRAVESRLLTPLGLRTLDPASPAYKPRFAGSMFERDAAYHNGTVWPYLLGAFVEAKSRLGASRAELLAPLDGVLARLDVDCAGHVAEVFDAEEPRTPGGCAAQAWSAAEVLRALVIALRAT